MGFTVEDTCTEISLKSRSDTLTWFIQKATSERTPVDTAVRHIHLLRTESTNTYLRELLSKSPDLEAFTVITAHDQTAGRGQKGNHWEK